MKGKRKGQINPQYVSDIKRLASQSLLSKIGEFDDVKTVNKKEVEVAMRTGIEMTTTQLATNIVSYGGPFRSPPSPLRRSTIPHRADKQRSYLLKKLFIIHIPRRTSLYLGSCGVASICVMAVVQTKWAGIGNFKVQSPDLVSFGSKAHSKGRSRLTAAALLLLSRLVEAHPGGRPHRPSRITLGKLFRCNQKNG